KFHWQGGKFPDLREDILQYFKISSKIIGVALIGMLYWVLPFIAQFNSYYSTFVLASVERYNFSNSWSQLFPDYAKITEVARLISRWGFQSYAPYNYLYFDNPILLFSSFAWVFVALIFPLLFYGKKEKNLILVLVLFSLILIFWGKGGNPPLGEFYVTAVTTIPRLNALFPLSVTYFLLPKFYVILTS